MSYNDEAFEEAIDESADEAWDEAARRGPARNQPPVRVPPRPSSYRAPTPASMANAPVTQSQLKAVTDRISAAMKASNVAINRLGDQSQRLAVGQGRLDAGLRKELAERKKEISAVRRDLQSTREISAVLPLLTSFAGPGSVLGTIAPLLLLGNDVSGDSTGAAAAGSGGLLGGLGGSGGGNGMLGIFALLAISGGLTPPAKTV